MLLARMRFRLNVAPKIISRITNAVLSQDAQVKKETDHYIDDIWVNESVVQVEKVRQMRKYGLVTKKPEPLRNIRMLGQKVKKSRNGKFVWS